MSIASIAGDFQGVAPGPAPIPAPKRERKKRAAPFSLRLSDEERARLSVEAAGGPLGAYIRAKVLGDSVPVRHRRSGLAVEDRRSLAEGLALLGRSRIASNLNQLAQAANVGALTLDPDTLAELIDAVEAVREIRRLLITALGLKPEREARPQPERAR